MDCLVNMNVERSNAIMHQDMEGSILSGSQRGALLVVSVIS